MFAGLGAASLSLRTQQISLWVRAMCARVKSMLSGFCFPNGVDLNESIQAQPYGAGLHYITNLCAQRCILLYIVYYSMHINIVQTFRDAAERRRVLCAQNGMKCAAIEYWHSHHSMAG